MRLTQNEIKIIKSNILAHITDAKIMLFGSRVDDNKRGGDIDIFVQTAQSVTLKEQLQILAGFELDGILRKVDLVLQTPTTNDQAIFHTASKEGVFL